MANVMNLKSVKDNPTRSGFDLSHKIGFTANVGELLPISCQRILPGDKIKIDLKAFTRTSPVNTAAYTRIREYFDVFFVPTRLLWDKFPQWIVQTDQPVYARSLTQAASGFNTMPYFTDLDLINFSNDFRIFVSNSGTPLVDEGGKNAHTQFFKLADLLGYAAPLYDNISSEGVVPTTGTALDPFPFLAYQKIYQDHYRNAQWEKARPQCYNLDYINQDSLTHLSVGNGFGSNDNAMDCMFTLRYANFNRDYFFGTYPKPQFGETALAGPLVALSPGSFDVNLINYNSSSSAIAPIVVGTRYNTDPLGYSSASPGSSFTRKLNFSLGAFGNNSGISVLNIRIAEALQKFREIQNTGRKDYKNQLYKQWGVKISDLASDFSQFVGGTSSNIEISEVVNQSVGEYGENATIRGKGVGVNSDYITFDNTGSNADYGYLMVIYHAEPVLDYCSNMGLDKKLTQVKATDFPIPVMDSIGMQEVYSSEFLLHYSKSSGINTSVIGYAPRYAEYKTAIDRVHGGFTYGGYTSWVAPVSRDSFKISGYVFGHPTWSYLWQKIRPSILNSIFVAQQSSEFDTTYSEDQLLVNCMLGEYATRNLSYDGMPY